MIVATLSEIEGLHEVGTMNEDVGGGTGLVCKAPINPPGRHMSFNLGAVWSRSRFHRSTGRAGAMPAPLAINFVAYVRLLTELIIENPFPKGGRQRCMSTTELPICHESDGRAGEALDNLCETPFLN